MRRTPRSFDELATVAFEDPVTMEEAAGSSEREQSQKVKKEKMEPIEEDDT